MKTPESSPSCDSSMPRGDWRGGTNQKETEVGPGEQQNGFEGLIQPVIQRGPEGAEAGTSPKAY